MILVLQTTLLLLCDGLLQSPIRHQQRYYHRTPTLFSTKTTNDDYSPPPPRSQNYSDEEEELTTNRSSGLVLCDIPGLIEGASDGVGLGIAFLRHVQRCKVLLHIIDATSPDPLGDFHTINAELEAYDPFLARKPQVVVINKMDVSEARERVEEEGLVEKLREASKHTRVLTISAATTENVKELMSRLKKFVLTQPVVDLPEVPEVDLSVGGLDRDADDFEVISDPAYPNQFRVRGSYIEQVAKMTHWEYPEAVERFGRQLVALGIADELQLAGAADGDLVMVDEYDFEFAPGMTNPYIPSDLFERDIEFGIGVDDGDYAEMGDRGKGGAVEEKEEKPWRPFLSGGYLDEDPEELVGFNDDAAWDLLEEADMKGGDEYFPEEGDEVWQA